jgi:release factor glutamine methyltransferase
VSGETVGALLHDATRRLSEAGSASARLDAELLLGHVLGIDRTTVLAHPEARPGIGQTAAFETAVARREAGEPVAYIRGLKEFFGLALAADARALIPRPETERLVELADRWIRERLTSSPRPVDAPPLLVRDVGTGSGAICVALAVTLRRRGFGDQVRYVATDRSPEALSLAVENAVAHGVADAIVFGVADLLERPDGDATGRLPATVDLVVANLPYIPTASIPALPVAASFEPRDALDGGLDGLDVVRRLLASLPDGLAPDGAALLEIGADQSAAAIRAANEALPGWAAEVHPDLSGSPRVLEVARPGGNGASAERAAG